MHRLTDALIVAVFAAAALGGCNQGSINEPVSVLRADEPTRGTITLFPPMPLSDVEERPVDLAVFPGDKVWEHVKVSNDQSPNGRADTPWIVHPPAAPAYWCCELPAWVEVDLGQKCYVSQVVVQPVTGTYGVSEFTVKFLADDGAEFDTDPPTKVSVTPAAPSDVDKPGVPLVAKFRARATQKLKLYFARGGASRNNKAYIKSIRVLGKPRLAKAYADLGTIPSEMVEPLAKRPVDLAVFTPETVKDHVTVSEDLFPNGRFDMPWIAGKITTLDRAPIPAYWCASRPGWAELTLDSPCYVNGVVVQPYSEAYGLTEFYVKVFDENGDEVDTNPPCAVSVPLVQPPGSGFKPRPLSRGFKPVLTRKLRFYFTRGGFKNNLIYIETIRVLGIPKKN